MPKKAKTQNSAPVVEEKVRKRSGHKLRYPTVALMEEAIEAYFAECDKKNVPYTGLGVAAALGFGKSHMNRLFNGDLDESGEPNERGETYSEMLERQFTRIAAMLESGERCKGHIDTVLRIFYLKQKWYGGYTDKAAIDDGINVRVTFGENANAECLK